jgi:predicted Zn-dependent peptidase
LPPRRTDLDFGAIIVSEPMPGATGVSLGLYFPTGSRHETPETNGSAHFIEHLIFKGTARRSADAVNREIDCLGGATNAFTSKELLCLHSRVLGEDLERAFGLLAELATQGLPEGIEAELERERGVILSEIRGIEDSPEELVGQLGDAALYGEHPLAFPIAGSARVVGGLGLPALRRHYREQLVASPVVVSAAGEVDHDRLVSLARARLNGVERAARPAPCAPVPAPGGRVLERDLEQVQLGLLARGVRARDPRWAAAELLCIALGDGYSSRLFREVRDRRGLSYSVGASLCCYADAGSVNVELGVDPERLAETLEVIARVLREIRDAGITAAELDAARRSLRAGLLLGHESSAARMAYLASLVLQREGHLELARDLERVERVGLDEVRELAAELLAEPLALAAVGPVPGGVLPRGALELGA